MLLLLRKHYEPKQVGKENNHLASVFTSMVPQGRKWGEEPKQGAILRQELMQGHGVVLLTGLESWWPAQPALLQKPGSGAQRWPHPQWLVPPTSSTNLRKHLTSLPIARSYRHYLNGGFLLSSLCKVDVKLANTAYIIHGECSFTASRWSFALKEMTDVL